MTDGSGTENVSIVRKVLERHQGDDRPARSPTSTSGEVARRVRRLDIEVTMERIAEVDREMHKLNNRRDHFLRHLGALEAAEAAEAETADAGATTERK